MPNDDVRLIVAGTEFRGWTGVTITTALDQAADAFSVTAPFDPDRADMWAAFGPYGYQPVQAYLDDELLITGRVDKPAPKFDAKTRSITIEGRSLAGALVDCDIEGPLEYSGLTLYTIATQLLRPFGLLARGDNDTNPLEVARADYGQKVFEFLDSLAKPRNLLLHSAPDGKLVITWATWLKLRQPVATLEEGKGPLLSVEASFDGSRRFSVHRVATQFAGEEDIVGEARDLAGAYRPSLSVAGDSDTDPSKTARRARAEAIASSMSIVATVAGWRTPAGARWQKGDAVSLRAPGAMLRQETKYSIIGAVLKIDETEGKVTDLRLSLPEVHAGDLPAVIPWTPSLSPGRGLAVQL